jgi:hypothetical protein
MENYDYPIPEGVHAIPESELDLRADSKVDFDLLQPKPVSGVKNIWSYWHSGYENLHPYSKRTIRVWYRRFSKKGWHVRVLNSAPGSPLNLDRYLDVQDPKTFPKAFREGTLEGNYAAQHTSDLIRFPLLLQHGGVYADMGVIQIGDLDTLWSQTIGNPASPYEVLSYNGGGSASHMLMNYFLCALPNNPYFLRCQKLLIALWDADGGKTSTTDMHASPLLKGVPLLGGGFTIAEDDGTIISDEDCQKLLSDYIIQGQAIAAVMGLLDEEDGWNGPQYVKDHVFAIDFMSGAQLVNEFTAWNGFRAYEVMSLRLPAPGETETPDQAQARTIVEECLKRSFAFKLAQGFILKVYKATLGSLWRDNEGSDDVPGTYGHWLRYGTVHWCPDELPKPVQFELLEPSRRGRLLG